MKMLFAKVMEEEETSKSSSNVITREVCQTFFSFSFRFDFVLCFSAWPACRSHMTYERVLLIHQKHLQNLIYWIEFLEIQVSSENLKFCSIDKPDYFEEAWIVCLKVVLHFDMIAMYRKQVSRWGGKKWYESQIDDVGSSFCFIYIALSKLVLGRMWHRCLYFPEDCIVNSMIWQGHYFLSLIDLYCFELPRPLCLLLFQWDCTNASRSVQEMSM